MITYEFKCTECSNEFDTKMKLSEYKVPQCPLCEHEAERHFRTAPNLDTYYPGSFKDQNPVHGI